VRKLKADCEQFELPIPSLAVKQVDWEQWNVLEEYWEGLKKHEAELFVKMKIEKLYEFQDYCSAWSEKVRGKEMNRQVVFIIKETDLFKSLFPLLRTLSSGILERDHWRQFWTLLRAERTYAAESMKLGDLLSQGRILLERQKDIMELLSRAQGEATLREALQELAIWWETAEFELTVY
jgi:dynein heavy chain 2, cytosolic